MDKELKKMMINLIRRASYRSSRSNRDEAKKAARIARNTYICAVCGPEVTHTHSNIQVDHIDPAVPLTGWDGFDGYIERMFCDIEGLQVLCKEHHKEKTDWENAKRKEYRKYLTEIEESVKIVDIEDEMFIQYLIDRFGIENVLDYLNTKKEKVW